MKRSKVTHEERARVLFHEFCLWRLRINTAYRHVACDANANRLTRELREIGYYVVYSTSPNQEGYNYAITQSSAELVQADEILLTDIDLGFNLYDDLVLNGQVK